ncbi:MULTISPECIES: methyl-accepting chemotaxis protein [unclassified Cupriavidus]|uniref:methyl-accepting chemotaxis protein n=1 Tax=unclassified Cupriavidus TaxID=2640874 RepID=UPI00313AE4BE
MGLRNTGIGTRLSLAFLLVVVLLAAVAAVGVSSLHGMNDAMHTAVEQRLLRVLDLNRVKGDAQQIGMLVRDAALSQDPAIVTRNAERIVAVREDVARTLGEFSKLLEQSGHPDRKAMLDSLTQAREGYNKQLDAVIQQLRASDFDGARSGLANGLGPAQVPYFEKLDELSASGRKMAISAVGTASERYELTRDVLIGLAIVAAVVAAMLGMAITRSITRPARHALDAAEALSAGRLGHTIEVRSQDEMGRMLGALEGAFGQLRSLVHGIQQAAGSIDTAAREISTGNTDLSQRTEEQAASLEQTAASMEQLTSTVRQNAENARQANQLAVKASDVASQGGRAVRGVVETMDGISKSSQRVTEIIGVIEGIAFQTNILALNAAVEAARAGEQGRGFSVVAAEVRTLARRSSAAAKEIGELINGSVRQVQDGAKQVEQAGRTMDDIVGAVRRVTDIMGEITAASQEQSAGIEQVSLAITQMEGVTQQNAALVEEAAAAAESLLQQAQGLVTEVAKFDIGGTQGAATSRAAIAHAAVPALAAPSAPSARALPSRLPALASASTSSAARTGRALPSPTPAVVREPAASSATTAPATRVRAISRPVNAAAAPAAARPAPAETKRPAQPTAAPAPRATREPAVPAAVRPPVTRKPQASVLPTRTPATPAKARGPVERQRREPVLQPARRPGHARPAASPALATAGAGEWETF